MRLVPTPVRESSTCAGKKMFPEAPGISTWYRPYISFSTSLSMSIPLPVPAVPRLCRHSCVSQERLRGCVEHERGRRPPPTTPGRPGSSDTAEMRCSYGFTHVAQVCLPHTEFSVPAQLQLVCAGPYQVQPAVPHMAGCTSYGPVDILLRSLSTMPGRRRCSC